MILVIVVVAGIEVVILVAYSSGGSLLVEVEVLYGSKVSIRSRSHTSPLSPFLPV